MRANVLVVEDDTPIRTLLDVVLTRAGFDVDVLASGRDALTLLSNVSYSAIAIDLFMHGTSGRDVLTAIAETMPELLPHTVIVSAAPGPEIDDVRDLHKEIHVVRKPFELHELIETVRAAARDAKPLRRDLGSEFCRRSILLGAHTGIVLSGRPEASRHLELVTSFGFAPNTIERFLPISADDPFPICRSYVHGRSIWLSSVAMAAPDYPLLSSIWEAAAAQALVTIPLVSNDRKIGAAGWAFRHPRAFEPAHRTRFEEVAAFVSSDLARACARSAAG